jgi:phosphate transport system protein
MAPTTGPHILETFDTALDGLQNHLLMMSSLVQRSIRNAMTGLMDRDDDLCNVVIADDEEIDVLEKQIDFQGIDLLRRFQPVATDLRQVIAAIKLNGNMERIGDQAVNVAKKARKLNRTAPLDETRLLEPMFAEALSMLTDVMRAFTEHDLELAHAIKPRDKKIDGLNRDMTDQLTSAMAAAPGRISDYVNLLFVSRYLERIGDHVKNISEDVVYALSAEDIRHTSAGRNRSPAEEHGNP